MAVNFVQIVSDLLQKGFKDVTIINSSYQVLGASSQTAVPSAWNLADGTQINENVSLQNDWAKCKDTGVFYFWKQKWSIVGDVSSVSINAKTGDFTSNTLFAREINATWFIIGCNAKGNMDKGKKEGWFASVYKAEQAMKKILEDHGFEEEEDD